MTCTNPKSILLKRSLFSFIVLLVVVSSCKKYEEGPSFSLRTKTARLSGDWLLQSITQNNKDVTTIYAQPGPIWTYHLLINKEARYIQTGIYVIAGEWKFGSKKESLEFINDEDKQTTSTKILKLTDKELWLIYPNKDGELYTKFKKIKK